MDCNFKSELIDKSFWCKLAGRRCPGSCILTDIQRELEEIKKQIKGIEQKII